MAGISDPRRRPAMPAARDARTVPMPLTALRTIEQALQGCGRLCATMDAQAAALLGLPKPEPSVLSQQIMQALATLADPSAAPPVERVDQHIFALADLNPEFVQRLMLERGWQQASLVVGSAQGETLARQMLHSAPPDMRLAEQVKLMPLAAGQRVEQLDGWALRAFEG